MRLNPNNAKELLLAIAVSKSAAWTVPASRRTLRLPASVATIRAAPSTCSLASYCITHGHTLLHRDADFDDGNSRG